MTYLLILSVIFGFTGLSILRIAQSIILILCTIKLIISFYTLDFSITATFLNTSTKTPLLYRISAIWSAHDTSLIFWQTLQSIFGIFIINKKGAWINSSIISSLSVFSLLYANPFIQNININDGIGFNVLLEDYAVAIHPPILYISYSLLGVLFAKSFTRESTVLIEKAAFGFLSLAIALGGWWAYRELGWGGYWFFDPVENISLIVWLLTTICIHTKESGYKKLPYLFALLGTALVRSSLLSSVHSFALESSAGLFIIAVFWIGFSIRSLHLNTNNSKIIYIYSLAASILTISIAYPILYKVIVSREINIGLNFYRYYFIPLLVVPILFFKKINILLLCSICTLSFLLLIQNPFEAIILGIAIYGLLKNRNIGHLGYTIICIGITLNVIFTEEFDFNTKVENNGAYSLKVLKIEYIKTPRYVSQKAYLILSENKREVAILKPEIRMYENMTKVSKTSIYSDIKQDFYAALIAVDGKDEIGAENVLVKVYVQKYVSLILLGIFLLCLGIII